MDDELELPETLEDEPLPSELPEEDDGGTELDDERIEDVELLDDETLLKELDDTELDGGTLEEEVLLELGGTELEETEDELDDDSLEDATLDEEALEVLAELEAGGGTPMCVRCGLRRLCGWRRNCRFLSGLRSARATDFFCLRFFMDTAREPRNTLNTLKKKPLPLSVSSVSSVVSFFPLASPPTVLPPR
jgi:hypothetical protein